MDYQFTSQTSNSTNIGSGWQSFFKNVDDESCQISECKIKKAGCKDDYLDKNVKVGAGPNFQIQANAIKDALYSENICYQCSNGKMTTSTDNIKVTHKANCANVLSGTNTISNEVTYQEDGVVKNIGSGYSSFFSNTKPNLCKVSKCILKNKGCKENYTGNLLSLDQTFPF